MLASMLSMIAWEEMVILDVPVAGKAAHARPLGLGTLAGSSVKGQVCPGECRPSLRRLRRFASLSKGVTAHMSDRDASQGCAQLLRRLWTI
jgi:hypothetical protein